MPKVYTPLTQMKYSSRFINHSHYKLLHEFLDFQSQKRTCFKNPKSLMKDLHIGRTTFYQSVSELEKLKIITHTKTGNKHHWYVSESAIGVLYDFEQILQKIEDKEEDILETVRSTGLLCPVEWTVASATPDTDIEFLRNLNSTISAISTTYDRSEAGEIAPKSILRVSEDEDSAQLLNRDEFLNNSSLWDPKRWDEFIASIPDQFGIGRATQLVNSFLPLATWIKYFTGPLNAIDGTELRCLLDALKSQNLRMHHMREIIRCTKPGELFSRIGLTSSLFRDSPKDAFEQIINEYTNTRLTIIKRWIRANAIDPEFDLTTIKELDSEDIELLKYDKNFYSRALYDKINFSASRLRTLTNNDIFKIQGNREGEGYQPDTVIEIAGYFSVSSDSKAPVKILDDTNNESQQGRYIVTTLAENDPLLEVIASPELFPILSSYFDFTVDDLTHARKLAHDRIREEAESLGVKLPSLKERTKSNIIQHDFRSSRQRKRQVN
jgi:hypothetical protein